MGGLVAGRRAPADGAVAGGQRADGSALGALTVGQSAKPWGAWLADSDQLLFVEQVDKGRGQITPPMQYVVWRISVTQGGLTVLARFDNFALFDAQLSPDRTKLLLFGYRWDLTTMEPDYAETLVLDAETGGMVWGLEDFYFSTVWMPDSGALLAIEDDELRLLPVGDAVPTTVPLSTPLYTDFGWFRALEWLPDGRLLLAFDDDLLNDAVPGRFLVLDVATGDVQDVP